MAFVPTGVVGTVGYWALGGLRRYVVTGGVRIEADGAMVVDVLQA